jgi:hypothetical protein
VSNIIQSLWIGDKLSNVEKLCLSSFTKNGCEHHLYVYDEVEGIPEGVTIKDGNEIMPSSEIFTYQVGEGRGSYSAFSNYFRYNLLLKKGGWWVDTDMICLKPFSKELKDAEYVFATEMEGGIAAPTSGLIKTLKGSPMMAEAARICSTKQKNTLQWGEVGPRLVSQMIRVHHLEEWLLPPETFCPVGYENWRDVLKPQKISLGKSTTLHLWNEMWRRSGYPKDRTYHGDSIFERLKEKYL